MHPFFSRAAGSKPASAAPAPAPATKVGAAAPASPAKASPAKAGTKRPLVAEEEDQELSIGELRTAASAQMASAPAQASPSKSKPAPAAGLSAAGGGGGSASSSSSSSSATAAVARSSAAAEEEEEDGEDEESSIGAASGGGAGGAAKKKARKSGSAASGGYGNDEFFGYIDYHPIRDAPWGGGDPKPGAPIPYSALVEMFSRAEAKGSRLYKTGQLANLLRSAIALSPVDVLPILYLTNGTLAPAFEGIELGVGDSILAKALSETTGKKLADIKEEVKAADGDFGPSAEAARSKQRTLSMAAPPAALTVRGVYAAFKSIALESGTKSVDKKVGTIKKLLVAAKGIEARYIMRGLQCRLRIGMTGKTVPVALAHAITLTAPLVGEEGSSASSSASSSSSSSSAGGGLEVASDPARGAGLPPVTLAPKGCGSGEGRKRLSPTAWEALQCTLEESSEQLKAVWSQLPSYDAIVPHLLRGGIGNAEGACQLTPGIPVAPMLAKPTKGVAEILDRLEGKPFTCEYKYDGERAQVHALASGVTRIFSRNSEEMSSKYPDLALALQAAMGRGGAAASGGAAAGGGGGGVAAVAVVAAWRRRATPPPPPPPPPPLLLPMGAPLPWWTACLTGRA